MKIQEIKNEVINALKIISKYPRMTETAKEELIDNGWHYTLLGSSLNCYSASKIIDIVDCRNNTVYYNKKLLLSIGICNTLYGAGRIYRGFTKKIEGTEDFTKEEVYNLKVIVNDTINKWLEEQK
ncbi:MAG: hypothetical protein SOY42_10870 [Clostridium sp.]|nr:hypothetical protein [Clostridium sp.]